MKRQIIYKLLLVLFFTNLYSNDLKKEYLLVKENGYYINKILIDNDNVELKIDKIYNLNDSEYILFKIRNKTKNNIKIDDYFTSYSYSYENKKELESFEELDLLKINKRITEEELKNKKIATIDNDFLKELNDKIVYTKIIDKNKAIKEKKENFKILFENINDFDIIYKVERKFVTNENYKGIYISGVIKREDCFKGISIYILYNKNVIEEINYYTKDYLSFEDFYKLVIEVEDN